MTAGHLILWIVLVLAATRIITETSSAPETTRRYSCLTTS